jgi:hypothetical protein
MLRLTIVVCLSLLSLAPSLAQQQPRNPELAYVFPAGGKLGTDIEVTVGGQALFGPERVYVSGTGITATVLGYKRPLSIGEVNRLRERIEEAYKKLTGREAAPSLRFGNLLALREAAREAGITDEQLRALEEFRRIRSDPKRQPNPQLEETVQIKLSISADAEPGMREIRVGTPLGLTNPVRFQIGQINEVTEVEPNDRLPDSCIGDTLPVVVNGQILPGDVDKFTFHARKGMKLVVAVSARELIPYLADAVPGWFQAVAAVYGPDGKEVAYNDDFRDAPDPVVHFVAPADGEYVLEIRDSIYRGREDFVYRAVVGELPFVTSVFPLGLRAGSVTTVTLSGWNLPFTSTPVRAEAAGVPAPVRVPNAAGPLPRLAVDDLPEVLEKEPNDTTARPQPLKPPVIVNGRIGHPGDADVFMVQGRKGDRLVAEVKARRLGSPVDSNLTITDSRGRRIGFNDDWEDKGAGLVTHHSDSYLMVTLPADGTYFIHVADTQGHGGAEFAYRLRVSAPRPDFELRVVPSSLGLRAGTSAALTVFALRRDGFAGEITLRLSGAPEGLVLTGGRIPAGEDKVRCTLTAAPREPIEPVKLTMTGSAAIGGRTVEHTAVPAQDMMQAFAYQHLVPAQDWLVAVAGRYLAASAPAPSETVVKIPVGGTVRVNVPRVGGPMARQVTLELSEPPAGITMESYEMRLVGGSIVLKADAKAKPGTRGNLIVDAFMVRPGGAGGRQAQSRRAPLGCLPAIPFEIVAR